MNRFEKSSDKITEKLNNSEYELLLVQYNCSQNKVQPPIKGIIKKLNTVNDIKFSYKKMTYMFRPISVYSIYISWD
jgi:hypothetical protein